MAISSACNSRSDGSGGSLLMSVTAGWRWPIGARQGRQVVWTTVHDMENLLGVFHEKTRMFPSLFQTLLTGFIMRRRSLPVLNGWSSMRAEGLNPSRSLGPGNRTGRAADSASGGGDGSDRIRRSVRAGAS